MEKITFGAKKSKVKTFSGSQTSEEATTTNKQPEILYPETAFDTLPTKGVKSYKNINEVFSELSQNLTNRFNVDDVSVYQISFTENYDISCKKIFGSDISSKSTLEKYYGFNCPMVITNADGFTDNQSHRARLIERFGKYTVIISSSAFEAFKQASELDEIRKRAKDAYKEVKKLL